MKIVGCGRRRRLERVCPSGRHTSKPWLDDSRKSISRFIGGQWHHMQEGRWEMRGSWNLPFASKVSAAGSYSILRKLKVHIYQNGLECFVEHSAHWLQHWLVPKRRRRKKKASEMMSQFNLHVLRQCSRSKKRPGLSLCLGKADRSQWSDDRGVCGGSAAGCWGSRPPPPCCVSCELLRKEEKYDFCLHKLNVYLPRYG